MFKSVGYCTCCETQLADAAAMYPAHHPWQGHMMTPGQWYEGRAYSATFITTNGTQIALTICNSCLKDLTCDKVRSIWRKCVQEFDRDLDENFRKEAGMAPLTAAQKKITAQRNAQFRGQTLIGPYYFRKRS